MNHVKRINHKLHICSTLEKSQGGDKAKINVMQVRLAGSCQQLENNDIVTN